MWEDFYLVVGFERRVYFRSNKTGKLIVPELRGLVTVHIPSLAFENKND